MPRSSVSGSSAAGSDNSRQNPQPASQADGQSAPTPPPPEPNDIVPIGPFEADDGDILLQIQGEKIATHKYLLRQFARLKEMLLSDSQQTTGTRPTLELSDPNIGVQDFRNAFSILYSNPLQGPTQFETPAFESALRLATVYEYPEFRTYAINHLARVDLDPVQVIKIARECNVLHWIEPACMKLVEREEMPGAEECVILGLDTFRDIALKREELRRRKLDALNPRLAHARSNSNGTTSSQTPEPMFSSEESPVDPEGHPVPHTRPDSKLSIRDVMSPPPLASSAMSRKERAKAFPTKPCFLNASRPEITLSPREAESLGDTVCLFVGDCRCKVLVRWQDPDTDEWKTEKRAVPCRLPSCAALAFKNLQRVQIAYAERIQNLESLVERMASDPTLARVATH